MDHQETDCARLQSRLQQLAGDKANLQLVLRLMERLDPLAEVEDLLQNLVHSIMDTIGGTNTKVYYWEAGELHYQDFLGRREILTELDDGLARQVAERREFIQALAPLDASLMHDMVVPVICSWGFPLIVGSELIGIVIIENLHIGAGSLGMHLPVFFQHTALILGNELRRKARDRAEVRLREMTEELDTYFNSALDLFAIADTGGNFRKLNPQWEAALGYPLEELEGKPFLAFVHPEDRERTLAEITALSSQEPVLNFVNRYRHQDGSWRWIEWRALANGPLVYAAARDITTRIEADRALRESEDKFAQAFRSAPVLMTISEVATGVLVDVNETFVHVAGWSREEALGRTATELGWVSVEDREKIRLLLIENGRITNHILPLRTKDGRLVTCLYSGELIEVSGSLRLLSTAQDITQRIQAEVDLAEQSDRLRAIFESSRDAIGVSVHGLHSLVNPAYLRMFGFEQPEELIGTPLLDLIAPESRSMVQSYLGGRGGDEPIPSDYEVKAQRRDGTTFLMEVHAATYQREGILQTVVSLRDITERRLAEERLQESEARYASIAKNSPAAIYRFSSRCGGLYFSPRILDLLGYTPEELLRQPMLWHDSIHPEDLPRVDATIAAAMSGQPSFDLVYRIRAASGDLRWFRDRASCLQQPDGEVLVDGIAMDITEATRADEERARLQAQLLQAQKMEGLGSLASGVAHDMNNVLGAILGLASAQIYAHAEGSRTHQAFETIMKACDRGGKMVKSLLSFARQNPAEERELDLNALVQEEVRLLEQTTLARVQLHLHLAQGLWPIRGDASALTHTIMNLCVNAADAMPDGGELTLQTRNHKGMVEVLVSDAGTGMSPEVLSKALDPFFTTKAQGKGTGLGLSMAYNIMRAHQGQLDIQSELGRGTCVTLRFPPCPGSAPMIADDLVAPRPSELGSLHLLLVDDDDLIQSSVSTILQVLEHRVTSATSGEEALACLEGGLQPDVVVLDLNMPGLGGAGTLPHLRRLRPNLPVLLATGRADQTALALTADFPRVTLLAKPFSLQEMKAALVEVLKSQD